MIKKPAYFAIPFLANFFLAGIAQADDVKFFDQVVVLTDKAIDHSKCDFSSDKLHKLKEDLKIEPIKTYISLAYDTNMAWGEANIMIPSQINEIMGARGISDQYVFNQSNPQYWDLNINYHPYRLRFVGFTTAGGKDTKQWIKNGTVILAIIDKQSEQECDLLNNPQYQGLASSSMFDQNKAQP